MIEIDQRLEMLRLTGEIRCGDARLHRIACAEARERLLVSLDGFVASVSLAHARSADARRRDASLTAGGQVAEQAPSHLHVVAKKSR